MNLLRRFLLPLALLLARSLTVFLPRMVPSRRGALLILLVASGLFSGCLSPTLPLPPPSRPELSSPNAEGHTIIRGRAQPQSAVFAQNLRTNAISGQRTEGSGRYEFSLEAMAGDTVLFWYSVGTEQSQGLYLEVPSKDVPGLAGAPGQ